MFSKLGYRRSGFNRATFFPATARANPRGPRVSRLCLFLRDTSRQDNGTFPLLGGDGETAVNGNPFGDVNAKFSIQPRSRTLIIKSRVQLLQLLQLPRRVSARTDGESSRVFVRVKVCLSRSPPPLSLSSLFLTLSLFLSPFFKPLQGFVASHSSISLSRKPISWYLNYARASALGTGTARERKKEDDEQSVGTREIGRQGGGKERT